MALPTEEGAVLSLVVGGFCGVAIGSAIYWLGRGATPARPWRQVVARWLGAFAGTLIAVAVMVGISGPRVWEALPRRYGQLADSPDPMLPGELFRLTVALGVAVCIFMELAIWADRRRMRS